MIFTLFVVVVVLVLECRVAVVSSHLVRVKQGLVEAGRGRAAFFVLVEQESFDLHVLLVVGTSLAQLR